MRRWQIRDFKRFLREGPDLDALRITRRRELSPVVDLRNLSRTSDLDESPFTTPPVEGMPFERGSAEDAAIRRILDRPEPRPANS